MVAAREIMRTVGKEVKHAIGQERVAASAVLLAMVRCLAQVAGLEGWLVHVAIEAPTIRVIDVDVLTTLAIDHPAPMRVAFPQGFFDLRHYSIIHSQDETSVATSLRQGCSRP